MLSLEWPVEMERHFREVVQKSYHGDVQVAVASLLKLHDRYGWKEQLREDVEAVRAEVRRQGGVTSTDVEEAIGTYRKQRYSSHA